MRIIVRKSVCSTLNLQLLCLIRQCDVNSRSSKENTKHSQSVLQLLNLIDCGVCLLSLKTCCENSKINLQNKSIKTRVRNYYLVTCQLCFADAYLDLLV